jgi:stringent starvation protein B
MDDTPVTSTKPYLIRAIHEWCTDNGFTPYLAVSVDEHTVVPREHVKGGEIVLNVSSMATGHLLMGNELITFQARFGGVARQISVPVDNVLAIYAKENGHGIPFEVAKPPVAVEPPDAPAAVEGEAQGAVQAERAPTSGAGPTLVLQASPSSERAAGETAADAGESTEPTEPPEGTPPRGGRPKLTRVK